MNAKGVGPPQPVLVFGMATASSGRGGPTPSALPESAARWAAARGRAPRPVSVSVGDASSGRGGPTMVRPNLGCKSLGSGQGVGPPRPVLVFGMATASCGRGGPTPSASSRSVFGSGPVWVGPPQPGSPNLGCESLGERPGGRSSAAGFSLRYGDSFLRPRRATADPIRLLLRGRLGLSHDRSVVLAEDQDRKAADLVQGIAAERCVVELAAEIGVAIFVELHLTAVQLCVDFDVYDGNPLPVSRSVTCN